MSQLHRDRADIRRELGRCKQQSLRRQLSAALRKLSRVEQKMERDMQSSVLMVRATARAAERLRARA